MEYWNNGMLEESITPIFQYSIIPNHLVLKSIQTGESMRSVYRDILLAGRGIKNYLLGFPLCVSFEITYRCNALCRHCHLHHEVDKELASPGHYGNICRQLKPVVAQVSGGEPLLRKDHLDIIRALKNKNGTPFIVLTTNGALLTKEKYYELITAGVDEISLSLDYPDERHDTFRGIPGLFRKIETLMDDLGKSNGKAITVSCVIQSDNYPELPKVVKLAHKWGIQANFSTYTWLRTHDKSLAIPKDEIDEFQGIIKQIIQFKKRYKNIRTSDFVLRNIPTFFLNEELPNCRAGKRFLIVNPNGTFSPCGLIIENYHGRRELNEKFKYQTSCSECYTSIRANTEKPWYYQIKDNIKLF